MFKKMTSYFHCNLVLQCFKSLCSTTAALLKVTDDWKEKTDPNNYVASVFIDLRKLSTPLVTISCIIN